MLKHVLAASAVALASVMAISAGPASAQPRIYGNVPYNGPTWGMMNPGFYGARYVNRWDNRFRHRYYNRYANDPAIYNDNYVNYGPGYDDRYVNYLPPGEVRPTVRMDHIVVGVVPYDGPTWGMMNPPGYTYIPAQRYVNMFGGTVGNATEAGVTHAQRCEAAYKSYDLASDSFLGYDGARHACKL